MDHGRIGREWARNALNSFPKYTGTVEIGFPYSSNSIGIASESLVE